MNPLWWYSIAVVMNYTVGLALWNGAWRDTFDCPLPVSLRVTQLLGALLPPLCIVTGLLGPAITGDKLAFSLNFREENDNYSS